jgi:release factor glutamine methyltransferase
MNNMELSIDRPEIRRLFLQLAAEYGSKLTLMTDKPEETIETNVWALWLLAAGTRISGENAMTVPLPDLSEERVTVLRNLLDQRMLGMPLAHLTGLQYFMGLEFICTKDALIPRKETEILANAAIELLETEGLLSQKNPRVLDLCCGCGNVTISTATHVPSCTVIGTDLSAEAVNLAKDNARELGCADRVTFFDGDLFAPIESKEYYGSFDLITCNPPYISTGKLASMPLESIGYEPKLAFDGGPLGVGVLWRLLNEAPRFIKPGGWLAFEAGLAQGPGMLRRMAKMDQYTKVKAKSDKAGNPRTILGQVNPPLSFKRTASTAGSPGPANRPNPAARKPEPI